MPQNSHQPLLKPPSPSPGKKEKQICTHHHNHTRLPNPTTTSTNITPPSIPYLKQRHQSTIAFRLKHKTRRAECKGKGERNTIQYHTLQHNNSINQSPSPQTDRQTDRQHTNPFETQYPSQLLPTSRVYHQGKCLEKYRTVRYGKVR